jgi:N-acetyl-anhydromuramyl-L-alanine amidase AmpD
MNCTRTGMSVLMGGLGVLLAGGCESQPSKALAVLPVHHLDLAPPSGRVPVPRGRRSLGPEDRTWAVGTYRPWRYLVIHHSATDRGSAALFDRSHRRRGWDELGYHFVIDNGRGGPDGRIEVGSRWRSQKWGAHCGGTPDNEYNNFGIGICLVGDLRERMPSAAQLASLRRLARYLVLRYGIPPGNVIGHRDAPNARTVCPGKPLHEYIHVTLRPYLARQLAAK